MDFERLKDLDGHGVIWVTRPKQGMKCDLLDSRPVEKEDKILANEWIVLTYGCHARRIVVLVAVERGQREIAFLTHQKGWSARTIRDFCKARREFELFFKELKQTCKLCALKGYSANGIRWEVWKALRIQLLMRYMAIYSH